MPFDPSGERSTENDNKIHTLEIGFSLEKPVSKIISSCLPHSSKFVLISLFYFTVSFFDQLFLCGTF